MKYTSKDIRAYITDKNGKKTKIDNSILDLVLEVASVQAQINRAFRKEKLDKLKNLW